MVITKSEIDRFAQKHGWIITGELHERTDRYWYLTPSGQMVEVVFTKGSVQIQGVILTLGEW
jgi:riboflavin synthase alpha subunit